MVLAVLVVGIIFYGLALNDPSEKSGWGDENNQDWEEMIIRPTAHEHSPKTLLPTWRA